MERLKRFIVKKLFHHGYVGGRHTAVENLGKGLPGHERGDVKKAVKELVREGVVVEKPTGYGLHVYLNPRKRREIEHYLE